MQSARLFLEITKTTGDKLKLIQEAGTRENLCKVCCKFNANPTLLAIGKGNNLHEVMFTLPSLVVVLKTVKRGEVLVGENAARGGARLLLAIPHPVLTEAANRRTSLLVIPLGSLEPKRTRQR